LRSLFLYASQYQWVSFGIVFAMLSNMTGNKGANLMTIEQIHDTMSADCYNQLIQTLSSLYNLSEESAEYFAMNSGFIKENLNLTLSGLMFIDKA